MTSFTHSNDGTKQHIIVVGNGMVGHHFVEQLIELGGMDEYRVTVLGEEANLAYDRVHLSDYFNGASAADLALTTSQYYENHGVAFHTRSKVVVLDRQAKMLTLEGGEQLAYDKLVLATGSYPFVPPMPGHDRENTFVYRTLEDLDAIKACAQSAKTGTVVGGGLLGLEAANALKNLGLETSVVEFAPRLMPVQLDETGGALLREMIEGLGVRVLTSTATNEIVDGESANHRMNFADGSHLETDLILFSAGIRPRDELARQAKLEVGERGGIVINNQCITSDDSVYAIGECALWDGRIFGLVAPGYMMAKTVAGHLMCNAAAAFTGADMSTKLKLLGCDVGSIGDAHAASQGARCFVYQDQINQEYRKLVVSEDGKKVIGAG